jgi:hypothetical protein
MRSSRWITPCGAVLFLHLVGSGPALAVEVPDALYLCGIVTEIKGVEAKVVVDVRSESCPGQHLFKLPSGTDASSLIVNSRKCFFIDSSTCKDGFAYTITTIDKE